MKRTSSKTEATSLNSMEFRNPLGILSPTSPEIDNTSVSSNGLLQLTLERIQLLQNANHPPHSPEQHVSRILRSEAPNEVQNFAQRLMFYAANSGLNSNLPAAESEPLNKWNHLTHFPISPNGHPSCDSVSPISTDSKNTLGHLASLSQLWSVPSPTTMNSFQHALTQLALLGLSSPPAVENRENADVDMNESSVRREEGSPNTNKRTLPAKENKTLHNGVSQSGCRLEEATAVSKVTIKQTADADEHFFKALRKLKVDGSSDLRSQETKKSELITTPQLTSPNVNKTAAEMAVDEHFEKSLAGFRSPGTHKLFESTTKGLQMDKPRNCINDPQKFSSKNLVSETERNCTLNGQFPKSCVHPTNRLNPSTSDSPELAEDSRSVDNSISSQSALNPKNSFKPKKNWLAQYDWDGNQDDAANYSTPISPNDSECFTFDQQRLNCSDNGAPESVNQNDTTENTGESKLRNDYPTLKLFNGRQGVGKDSAANGNIKIPDTDTLLSNNFYVIRNGHDCKESDEMTHKDSATSPINCDHEISSLRHSSTSVQDSAYKNISETQFSFPRNTGISKSLPNKCRSNSSSPIAGCNGAKQQIIPCATVVSPGSLSGSTYSLDSSLGHTNFSCLEQRDADSGIDIKSLASVNDEQISSEPAQQPSEISRLDSTDPASWSLRKRACSEASPWSTLKRSRSVVTAPLTSNEPNLSYSPVSTSLLTGADDESSSDKFIIAIDNPPDYTAKSPREFPTKESADLDMSKPPELIAGATPCGPSYNLQMPRLYDMYNRACEVKSSSEPCDIPSNRVNASLPTTFPGKSTPALLRLKSDSKLFVVQ